ncbi:unnamed protein product [Hymenolepis diminuta]|uniref:Ovule protein n=1 Tax=Hymenolepis diminuta TaxID=6216 RepID=A0A0R3SJT5_HYMDI|nr:unnamed protein product [Hymenolepis diminuta]VUZ40093.1 unnamed protein product [Hymenolepis diminuta]
MEDAIHKLGSNRTVAASTIHIYPNARNHKSHTPISHTANVNPISQHGPKRTRIAQPYTIAFNTSQPTLVSFYVSQCSQLQLPSRGHFKSIPIHGILKYPNATGP